jgi:hypothetical protein
MSSLLLQLPLFSFLLFNPDLILTPLEVSAGIVSHTSEIKLSVPRLFVII